MQYQYAVVRFIDEEDAPGIVATNWINYVTNTCSFPNVKTEEKKNKLLIARQTPGNDWFRCPIRVLKEFSSYQAARSQLSEAEETSNLDSDDASDRPRKRKKKHICLPGEESIIEEIFIDSSKDSVNLCPTPPPQPSYPNILPNNSSQFTSFSKNRDSEINGTSSNQNIEYSTEIEGIKKSQATMWGVLEEFLNVAEQINTKLDTIMNRLTERPAANHIAEDNDESLLLSLLPVGLYDFQQLDEKIAENSALRLRLAKILLTSGGRDAKAFVASVMRKLISDDVGETYSLTGKRPKTGLLKQSFEKTAVYKLVLEVCFSAFSTAKESMIREAVSDWLMQSKFRKSRREKRMNKPQEDLLPVVKVED